MDYSTFILITHRALDLIQIGFDLVVLAIALRLVWPLLRKAPLGKFDNLLHIAETFAKQDQDKTEGQRCHQSPSRR